MMRPQKQKKKTMDFFLIEKTLNNEEGMVMIFTLMVLMILTISGVAAINISNNETSIVRNEQFSASEFYNAETGLNDARINFNNWLTNDFLNKLETESADAFYSISTTDAADPLSPSLATIRVRCIEDTGNSDVVFPDPDDPDQDDPDAVAVAVANVIPAMPHKASPPVGSGYSVKHFEVRRYSITSTSNTGNTVLQTGVWKVFNKY